MDDLACTAYGLFSSGYDGVLKQWDLDRRICVRQCRWALPHPITSLAVHASGKVAVALRDGQCHFLRIMRAV